MTIFFSTLYGETLRNLLEKMIKKIAQAVLKLILPDVTEHLLKVFKLGKIMDYVELENDADKKIIKLEEQMKMVKGNATTH